MSRTCWEQAANRHWRDAKTLFSSEAVQNADQLLGYCADSVVNILLDLETQKQGAGFSLPRSKREHINRAWTQLQGLRQGSLSGYFQRLPRGNPFGDWNVQQRYDCNRKISSNVYEKHRDAACKLLEILEQLHVAGILSGRAGS